MNKETEVDRRQHLGCSGEWRHDRRCDSPDGATEKEKKAGLETAGGNGRK
ncbi:hypothetical protein LINPERHAP1_LOCUS10141 [Linum perenne]